MMRAIWILSFALMATASAHAASIYKWVDNQGNTHFSSQPPAHAPSVEVKPDIPKSPSATAVAAPAEDPQKAIDQEVKHKVAEQEQQRKEYCLNQRTNLAQLKNNPRISIEENGELKRMTEPERQSKIAEVEANIAKEC